MLQVRKLSSAGYRSCDNVPTYIKITCTLPYEHVKLQFLQRKIKPFQNTFFLYGRKIKDSLHRRSTTLQRYDSISPVKN
ncbi:hypothetical protein RN001_008066 [Aquatica leii]|uniref:Uncharacterized protein n=1 Tax=Aquatica leii TaxID=1421715 RepID=A0AAN7Q4U4_9COLE|nr:hypothetical protein RN001_008066 [Aquatica leii]